MPHFYRITRQQLSNQIRHDYTPHCQILESVTSEKYLGFTLNNTIDWGSHISHITSKATKTVGFIRRNLALAPKQTKVVAYNTLVRPQLEYASPIWNPYCQSDIYKLEKVQRTAARWTCRRWRNQSHVGEMLDDLQCSTLESHQR